MDTNGGARDPLDDAFNEGFKQGVQQLVEDFEKSIQVPEASLMRNHMNAWAVMQLKLLAKMNGVQVTEGGEYSMSDEKCPKCGWRKTIQNDNCDAPTHVNNRSVQHREGGEHG